MAMIIPPTVGFYVRPLWPKRPTARHEQSQRPRRYLRLLWVVMGFLCMSASEDKPFCLEACCERGGDWLTEARDG